MSPELQQRVVWGGLLAILALGFVLAGGWLMTLAVALMMIVIAREWTTVTRGDDHTTFALIAVLAALAVVMAGLQDALLLLAVAVAAVLTGFWRRSTWLTGGAFYASALGVSLVALRGDANLGLTAILFVLAIVWATDIGAYFAGRQLGGPKLWPAVSPKKTWSGAIGGLAAAVVAGALVVLVSNVALTFLHAVLAAVLSVAAQAGDLFESAIKRRFGVKDASALIPGHGGLMDRVDSLTFAAAAAALIGAIHMGGEHPGVGLLVW